MNILLVDGTNVVMRYAHAMAPGAEIADHPAVVEMVPEIMRAAVGAMVDCARAAEAPYMIVALDSGVDSWRKTLYPEYKGRRLTSTLTWSNRLHFYLNELGILSLRWPGEEADDIIATLAARVGVAGKTCAVLSGDGDMLQLASMWCDVWQFGRGDEPKYVKRSMAYVKEKFGLQSAVQLPLFKALVGDPSDNLPGVKGIGKKKAQVLLQAFQTADALRGSAMVPPQQFDLMLKLVTLNDKVPLPQLIPTQCRIPQSLMRESAS